MQAWDEIISLEEMRLDITKQAMLSYMKSRSEIYSSLDTAGVAYASIGDIVIDPKITLATDKIIIAEEARILREETKMEDLRQALVSWPFQPPPESSLVMKEGELWRETGVKKRWKKSFVVITHDFFIHVLQGSEESSEILTSFTLKNAAVKEMIHMEEPLVEITEAKPSGMMSFLYSAKKLLFRFDDEEMKQDWIKYFRL